MKAIKQEALKTIHQLPDDADMDEIMYRLCLLDKIRIGREDVVLGKTLTGKQLKQEIDTW
jgi:hypothetical protein